MTGANKEKHCRDNKKKRVTMQESAVEMSYWTKHKGTFNIPTPKQAPQSYIGQMRPSGLALDHPAAQYLLQYSMKGCPVKTGKPWSLEEISAAIERGPHASALEPEAMKALHEEVEAKVTKEQVRVVEWDKIKYNHPEQLKVSPIEMIPHKSRLF